MRRAAKVDDNQKQAVAILRSMGCSVTILSAVGMGCPDLLVGLSGKNYLIEVKDPSKPKADRQLTERQVEWHGNWKGQAVVLEADEEFIKFVRDHT